MSDTPRTDREVYKISERDFGFEAVGATLCRMMERELAEKVSALSEERNALAHSEKMGERQAELIASLEKYLSEERQEHRATLMLAADDRAYAELLARTAAEFEAPLSYWCDGPERDALRAALAKNPHAVADTSKPSLRDVRENLAEDSGSAAAAGTPCAHETGQQIESKSPTTPRLQLGACAGCKQPIYGGQPHQMRHAGCEETELRHQSGQQDPRRFTLTEKRAPSQTDVDYAVEHAGYLATAAQSLLATCGARDLACQELEEVEESADCSSGARLAMERANESYGDALHAMRDAIYEFEKRRDRALQSVACNKQDEDDHYCPHGAIHGVGCKVCP